MTIAQLIVAAQSGSLRAAGKLLTLVESPRRDEVFGGSRKRLGPGRRLDGAPGRR